MFGESRNWIHTKSKNKMHVSPSVTLVWVHHFFSSNWATVSVLCSWFETITTERFYRVNLFGFKISALLLSCFISLHRVLSWCCFLSWNILFYVLQGKHNLCLLVSQVSSRKREEYFQRLWSRFVVSGVFSSPQTLFKASTFSSPSPSHLPRTPFQY